MAEEKKQAISEYIDGVTLPKPGDPLYLPIMFGSKTHTTVKPTDEEIAAHQAKHGINPCADGVLFGKYLRRYVFGTQQKLTSEHRRDFSHGFTAILKPDRTLTMVDLYDQSKPYPFTNVPLDVMGELVAFCNCPVPIPAREWDKKFEERAAYTSATAKRWVEKPWKYVDLDTDKSESITSTHAFGIVACRLGDVDGGLHVYMEKAYRTQTAITVPAMFPSGEALLVPPDHYDDDQKFCCQQCGKEYVYGDAKAAEDKDVPRFNPLCFCCVSHAMDYYEKHGRGPVVGAEIRLGPWEKCVPFGKEDFADQSHKVEATVGELIGIDDVARMVGLEPTHVIHDSVVYDVTKAQAEELLKSAKPKKLTPEQIERLRSVRK